MNIIACFKHVNSTLLLKKYLMEKYPPFFLAGISIFAGLFFFSLLNIIQGGTFEVVVNTSLFLVIYLGLLTVIAYALYNFAICTLPASKFSPFLFMLPVAAVFFGWFFLGETINIKQFGACILVALGIAICQINTKKKFVKVVKKLPFSDWIFSLVKK